MEGVLRLNGQRDSGRESYRPNDQRAGELIYLISNFLLGGTSCPEQVWRQSACKGCQQSWSTPWQDRNSQGTQGMVEAERTEELKVANLSTSAYSVAL